MKLVVHDAAVRGPLGNAVGEWPPQTHARGLDPVSLPSASLCLEKLIQGFLFAVLPEPQGLTGIQVADYGDELHLLAEVNLIHTHLHQRVFATRRTPPLQIPQVDRSHSARRQPKLSGYLANRCAFAR